MNLKPIGVLLAGGEGKRFAPFVINKTLLPLLGKPFIYYLLEEFSQLGVNELIVVGSKSVLQAINSLPTNPKLKLINVVQPKPLGMADAILQASQHFNARPVLIRTATSLLHPLALPDIKTAITNGVPFLVGCDSLNYKPGGYLEIDSHQQILNIIEKPDPNHLPSQIRKFGYDLHPNSSKLVSLLSTTPITDEAYENVVNQLIKLQAYQLIKYQQQHFSLKYGFNVLDAMKFLLANYLKPAIHPSTQIEPNVSISGEVYIGANSKIMSGAVVNGPVWIGDNVIIANHTLVRSSIIESCSIIGAHSEVARSYIGPNIKMHRAFVGDSILESDINLAANTVIGNLRFDDQDIAVKINSQFISTQKRKFGCLMAKGVKTGINSSIMPGSLIPAKEIIYPNQIWPITQSIS